MKRWRIGLAVVAMTASGIALADLWPRAREAAAILAAQDDPVALSDLQVDSVLRANSALRNQQNVVVGQIEAALAAHDSGLAASFVDLANAKNVALPDD